MKKLLPLLLLASISLAGLSQDLSRDIRFDNSIPDAFPLVSTTGATDLYVDSNDHWLVQRAAILLQQDIGSITGRKPTIIHTLPASASNLVIIGSLDGNPLISQLYPRAKDLQGKWEAFSLAVIPNPAKGIRQALIITGSDRRGTAYGVLELSKQIGISPWYWWADVPATTRERIYLRPGTWDYASPKVKYRGIFINDEAPALSGWTQQTFGGFNHAFYEKVFELLLRMKANYLWPAMWGNAFNDDDTLNPILADKYGIVMGTSHHEPMLRAQTEWKRYGSGPWDYTKNAAVLDSFWRTGIRHMGRHESIVTIGMRGDGDMPMTEGSNIALLEKIVQDQRDIIRKITTKDPAATPQLWALYKEVQAYYDKGMRVPDDVTLLLCDDNWGNIRKLPRPGTPPRQGGYGIYYHFDYVGDPRNYKWLNTNPIPRVWQQMHLAKQYGADRIWIVNVGDIKPLELPIQFFLDYAWDPDKWPADSLQAYTRSWAAQQFGPQHATAIADILEKHTRYNGRRKPELLSPDTYSLLNYGEADRIVRDYNLLARQTDSIYQLLPPASRDAYYQLVSHPVLACANLNELYVTIAKNRRYAAHRWTGTDSLAARATALFQKDSALSQYYNTRLSKGKWNHMMDQTHIGYTYWQQPPANKMPEVFTLAPGQPVTPPPADPTASMVQPLDAAPPGAFIQSDGYISIEAEHYSQAVETASKWQRIPGLGRTLSGMQITPGPSSATLTLANSPHLDYDIFITDTNTLSIQLYFSPPLDVTGNGLHYAVSIDDETPQTITLPNIASGKTWETTVADNIFISTSALHIPKPGKHTLTCWLQDPNMVLQKIVIDAGGVKPSYLGPPESSRKTATLSGQKGLKDYYKDFFPIGVAVSPRNIAGSDTTLLLREFNSLTPENAMKMGPIHPEQNRYNWKDADAIVSFAQDHGMKVRGHNLCWHQQTPAWIFKDAAGGPVTKDSLLQRLKDHISTVVGRYKGRIYAWDVVNEAVADDSTLLLRHSPWYDICGEEFITRAFEYAHQADPNAQLFYNDYNTERPEKRERIYRLLKKLIAAGLPITGVGLQGHWSIYEPSGKQLEAAIAQFSSLGLKVQITELDISVYPWEKNKRSKMPGEDDSYTPLRQNLQTAQYKTIFSIFRSYKNLLTGITFWNLSDKHTWLDEYPVPGRKNYPLLFDNNGQKKAAYDEVIRF